jgi:myosin heavy subunit
VAVKRYDEIQTGGEHMSRLKELRDEIVSAKSKLAEYDADSEDFAEYIATVREMESRFEVLKKAAEQSPDADASWTGETSLDEHRQKRMKAMPQPGFGDAGKVKTDGE